LLTDIETESNWSRDITKTTTTTAKHGGDKSFVFVSIVAGVQSLRIYVPNEQR